MNTALEFARAHRERNVNELIVFLRIPSISTLPDHKPHIEKAAHWLVAEMTRVGLQNAKVMPTKGHPAVYADWLGAGSSAPTALIYGHYDVQPVDPLDLWQTPPFEPDLRDGRLYARGATDDKGQVYLLVKAMEA